MRDPRFQDHRPGAYHPESPERLRAIDAALVDPPVRLVELAAREATHEELARVHTLDYIARIDGLRGRSARLDSDTALGPASAEAAFLAAGATIELFTAVAKREVPPGIALVRPPGHHALAGAAMGFCVFNNVAIAARALIAAGLAERIAIYDWDVHHGNGTQDTFYEDDAVLYMSTHQWPFYPGTGGAEETGAGRGAGATVNVPLPEGSGDAALLDAIDHALVQKTWDFCPDMILISAGFDPYEEDPLGGLRVTIDGFQRMAARVRELSERVCHGKIAAVLEGGYNVDGLGQAVRGLLEVWSAP